MSVASTQYQRVYRHTFDCFNDLGDLVPIMCSEVPNHTGIRVISLNAALAHLRGHLRYA